MSYKINSDVPWSCSVSSRLVLVCRCKQVPLDRRWLDLYAGRLNKTVDKDFWFHMYGGQRKHTLKQSWNCIISTPASALSRSLCLFGTKFTLNISKDQSDSDKKPERRAKDKTFIPLSFSLATFIYSLSVQLWGMSTDSFKKLFYDVQQVVFCDTVHTLFVVCVRERKKELHAPGLLIFVFQNFWFVHPDKSHDRVSAYLCILCFSLFAPAWRVRQSRVYVRPDTRLNSIKMSKLICHSGRAVKSVPTCKQRRF